MEEKEDLVVKEEPIKKKSKIGKIIGIIVFWIIIIALSYLVYIGYSDMKRIEAKDNPKHYSEKITYEKDGKDITVYKYFIYKIVEVKTDKETSASFKLWFLDDIG